MVVQNRAQARFFLCSNEGHMHINDNFDLPSWLNFFLTSYHRWWDVRKASFVHIPWLDWSRYNIPLKGLRVFDIGCLAYLADAMARKGADAY
jgi:2-polyprenyl-3-methyl-5-hydroxy-6-metoxy-1,4-benzoquinol methylase